MSTRIEPQPPTAFVTVEVSDDVSHSWCLKNQSKFELPNSEKDWLTVRKPFSGADPKLIGGVWFWTAPAPAANAERSAE